MRRRRRPLWLISASTCTCSRLLLFILPKRWLWTPFTRIIVPIRHISISMGFSASRTSAWQIIRIRPWFFEASNGFITVCLYSINSCAFMNKLAQCCFGIINVTQSIINTHQSLFAFVATMAEKQKTRGDYRREIWAIFCGHRKPVPLLLLEVEWVHWRTNLCLLTLPALGNCFSPISPRRKLVYNIASECEEAIPQSGQVPINSGCRPRRSNVT